MKQQDPHLTGGGLRLRGAKCTWSHPRPDALERPEGLSPYTQGPAHRTGNTGQRPGSRQALSQALGGQDTQRGRQGEPRLTRATACLPCGSATCFL